MRDHSRRSRSTRRLVTAAALSLLPISGVALGATSAGAITGGPDAPLTLPAVASSFWQTNGAVWSMAYAEPVPGSTGVLFVGGDFTSIRPPGTAEGDAQQLAMGRLAAFNANGPNAGKPCVTATPCPGIGAWKNPAIDARVYALATTPDGSRLYAGGDYVYSRGVKVGKGSGFALTAATGPQLSWNPGLGGGSVRAVTATSSAAYYGGTFTTVNGVSQPKAASYSLANGAFRSGWTPTINGPVYALLPSPTNSNVVIGGSFTTVDGATRNSLAQVDQATGDVNGPIQSGMLPAPIAGSTAPAGGLVRSDVKGLATDGTNVYVAVEGSGAIYEGTLAFAPSTGAQVWKNYCAGAAQAVAVLNNSLYSGSHAHNCSSVPTGGFPQNPFETGYKSWNFLRAEQAQPDSTVNSGGRLRTWFPKLNAGPTNGSTPNELGPRAVVTDGTSIFVGGQFTTVNGASQVGITRFSPGPAGDAPSAPVVTGTSANPGTATVRWTASNDDDDTYLDYTIYRDGEAVATYPDVNSPWWKNSTFVYRDPSAPAGDHVYSVSVADANGLTNSAGVTISVAGAPTGGYASAVLADNPSSYWRLDETSGTVARDSSGHNATGTYVSSAYTYGRPGAIDGNTGVIAKPPNASAKIYQTGATKTPPTTYSLELWFRGVLPSGAPTAGGGRLIGWSNSTTGTSTSPDKTVYMTNEGQLIYAIFNSDTVNGAAKTCRNGNNYAVAGTCYAWSRQTYNDGGWHHLVATQSPTAGMVLYVDGKSVASQPDGVAPKSNAGLWRVGGDSSISKFPRTPTNQGFVGDIDEVAIYPTALSATQVAAHYRAAE